MRAVSSRLLLYLIPMFTVTMTTPYIMTSTHVFMDTIPGECDTCIIYTPTLFDITGLWRSEAPTNIAEQLKFKTMCIVTKHNQQKMVTGKGILNNKVL